MTNSEHWTSIRMMAFMAFCRKRLTNMTICVSKVFFTRNGKKVMIEINSENIKFGRVQKRL